MCAARLDLQPEERLRCRHQGGQLVDFGVTGNLLGWVREYLRNRASRVLFKGASSTVQKFKLGTPQVVNTLPPALHTSRQAPPPRPRAVATSHSSTTTTPESPQVTALRETVAQLTARCAAIEARFEAIDARFAAIEAERLDNIAASFEKLTVRFPEDPPRRPPRNSATLTSPPVPRSLKGNLQ
ncbi:hypothetical protein O3P69_009355 [Scylla paramamosain]|uniref:Uncharacterized protein n=1 Tax=Scylla paramamosain TaxID=85552 RepID=A0AAW0TCN9_SCYPA